ncbi:hypothetical protein ABT213_25955 [Streptomyces sp. NPDC001674]|uniref:hypothetical protein n=1 Tax=Streptomyces sp. NPDC001674 TaxID=3154394 RepID=UPI00332DFBAB
MTALLRYQGALLLRSQHWIAPFAVYAAFVAIGVRPGDRTLDSLGYAAAGLVPLTAWLVRICVTAEPPAARACTAAAAGPSRVRAAALLTGLGAALLTGVLAAAYTLLAGDLGGHAPGPAVLAGAGAVAVCALTGRPWGRCGARRWWRGAVSPSSGRPSAPCWPGWRPSPRRGPRCPC